MANLPANTDMTGASVTQGQFRTRLNDVLDYLRDILGSTGTPAAARAALGLGGLAVRNDVGPAEIASAAVTEGKLAANACTTPAYLDGSITLPKLASTAQTALAVPVGTVLYVARSTAPDGYLKCNGAAVSRTTYAALFAVIGTTFGAGNGSTTFNLPDLRGEFVRGWDDGRAVDSGRGLGTWQDELIKQHTHRIDIRSFAITGTNDNVRLGLGGTGGTISDDATNGMRANFVGGGAETRPRNVALLAVIRF